MLFHKYNLIFTGIPKNASSSVYDTLKNSTDRYHHHITIINEYNENDTDLMEIYTSVCIIRNPYDRFISACYQIRRDNPDQNNHLSLDEIIEQEMKSKGPDGTNEVFIAQHKFVCFGSRILIDNVLRYESLTKDWEEFAVEYNKTHPFPIPLSLPTSNNTEDRKDWKQEIKSLSDFNFNLINQKYEKDFKLFDYKMLTR
tara:strand:- start:247 stop:843 length:597 start_codon:yes stop_codon:yes gene_type:complete